jgi:hypothetical protein
VSAVRQWVSVPAGFIWTAAADRLGAHRALLVVTLAACTVTRMCLNLGTTFSVLLVSRGQGPEAGGFEGASGAAARCAW